MGVFLQTSPANPLPYRSLGASYNRGGPTNQFVQPAAFLRPGSDRNLVVSVELTRYMIRRQPGVNSGLAGPPVGPDPCHPPSSTSFLLQGRWLAQVVGMVVSGLAKKSRFFDWRLRCPIFLYYFFFFFFYFGFFLHTGNPKLTTLSLLGEG